MRAMVVYRATVLRSSLPPDAPEQSPPTPSAARGMRMHFSSPPESKAPPVVMG
jgi:hypothetical protein